MLLFFAVVALIVGLVSGLVIAMANGMSDADPSSSQHVSLIWPGLLMLLSIGLFIAHFLLRGRPVTF